MFVRLGVSEGKIDLFQDTTRFTSAAGFRQSSISLFMLLAVDAEDVSIRVTVNLFRRKRSPL